MKKYKNAKSAKVTEETYIAFSYKYTCPFCKANIKNYNINPFILRVKCSYCMNEIILIWDE